MKRTSWLIAFVVCATTCLMAQNAQPSDPIAEGLASVVAVAGEAQAPSYVADSSVVQAQTDNAAVADSSAVQIALQPTPLWKKKLYYGYNFDIYYHSDTRHQSTEKGWSIAIEPELGWKLKERLYFGLRFGGSYQDTYSTYTYLQEDGSKISEDLRIQQGSWNVTPYVRYCLKTIFHDKVGIWLEAHIYTGMEFPNVTSGTIAGTDYEGLKHSVIYGAQISPVITYQFSKKRSFQIFFSILSLGYSGTAFCYVDPLDGSRRTEYTNDVIIFSGKLRNLLANQFTPGLYGLKFGIQKTS